MIYRVTLKTYIMIFSREFLPKSLWILLRTFSRREGGEITDEALKYYTLLFELRFAGPKRNFRVKIEISTREKELKTAIMPLRGGPVLTLEPSFLMTEKLLTFVDRQAGRDIFDAWFILKNAYPLDKAMVEKVFGNRANFH